MLQISKASHGTMVSDANYPCSVISNSFIPIRVLNSLQTDIDSSYENFIYTYFKPSITSGIRTKANSTNNLINYLSFSEDVIALPFGDTRYYVSKGLIQNSKGNVILCLGFKKEILENYTFEKAQSMEDTHKDFTYDDYVLFIASEIFSLPENTLFARRLQKVYLEDCYQKGIEVRIVPYSIIEKNTFANSLHLRFNTIDELDYHLKFEVKNFLLKDDEWAAEEMLNINIPPIVIEEVIEENLNTTLDSELDFFDDIERATINYGTTYIDPTVGERIITDYISGIDSYDAVGNGSITTLRNGIVEQVTDFVDTLEFNTSTGLNLRDISRTIRAVDYPVSVVEALEQVSSDPDIIEL